MKTHEEWLILKFILKNRWVKKNKKLIDEHENKSNKSPTADYIEELKKLAELRDLGIITDEEFEAKKKELLGL